MSKLQWCLMALGCSLYAAYIVGTVEYLHTAQSKMIHQQHEASDALHTTPIPDSGIENTEARPIPPQPAKGQNSDAGSLVPSPDVANPGQVIPSPPQVHGQPAVFYADSVGYPDTYRPDIRWEEPKSGNSGDETSPVNNSSYPRGSLPNSLGAIDEVYAKQEPQETSFPMQLYNGGPSVRMRAVQVPEPSTVILLTWGTLLALFFARCRQL